MNGTNLCRQYAGLHFAIEEAERLITIYSGPVQGAWEDWVRIGGFKFVLQNDGFWSHSPRKSRILMKAANRVGWTLAVHGPAMWDHASWDGLMEVLAEADAERPLAGRGFSFEHWIGTKRPDHVARLRDWGITVAPNPPLSYFGAGRSYRMHEALQQVRIAKPSSYSAIARPARMGSVDPRLDRGRADRVGGHGLSGHDL